MGKSGIECECTRGAMMCHHRPCLGTPEEFEAIIDAGYADKLRIDYWAGLPADARITLEDVEESREPFKEITEMLYKHQQKSPNPFTYNVEWLSGGTENDSENYRTQYSPTGTCKLLSSDEKCILHTLGLKPEQGRESCCVKEKDTAKDNIHYAYLWDTPKGKEVLEKFKKAVNLNLE